MTCSSPHRSRSCWTWAASPSWPHGRAGWAVRFSASSCFTWSSPACCCRACSPSAAPPRPLSCSWRGWRW